MVELLESVGAATVRCETNLGWQLYAGSQTGTLGTGRPEGLPRTATSDEITDMGDLLSKVTLCACRVRAAKPDH